MRFLALIVADCSLFRKKKHFGKSMFHIKLVLDIFQQFTFEIKQKEQYTNLKLSNSINRCDR